jgi:hypothetical protein
VRRRDRQDVGKVVEAAVRCFISGQLRRDVDVEREEIADRIRVLDAVEPMHGADATGFGCASHALSIACSRDEAAAS